MGAFTAELLIFSQKLATKACLIIFRVDYQLRACQVIHSAGSTAAETPVSGCSDTCCITNDPP